MKHRIIGYKEIDPYTDLLIISASNLMNTIKSAFLTPNGIEGEKETSIHHDETNRKYIIRYQKIYYLDTIIWLW